MWTKMGPVWLLKPPPPPQKKGPPNEKINKKKCSSDYFHILLIVELWCDCNMFVGPWSIIYKMFMSFCWPMYTDLGRPGDTFAVAGDQTI